MWFKSSCEVPCNKYDNRGKVSKYFDPFELYRVTVLDIGTVLETGNCLVTTVRI